MRGPGAGACDDVGRAIAIHIARRHADAPGESRRVRKEGGHIRRGAACE
jgi:hypothetical protein